MAVLLSLATVVTVRAGYKEEIGLTALLQELGAAAPTGTNVTVSQVEILNGGGYVADTSDPELIGKTFNLKSGASGVSYHANSVARYFYGTSTGVAPAVRTIDAYEAGNFLGAGFLNAGNPLLAPAVEARRIQNHSWGGSSSSAQEINRRLDFTIKRDGFVAVIGLNNGSGTTVPDLLAHSYNGISVGVPSGEHSRGGTLFDTAGRIKPEIVAPSADYSVSYSAAVVSGAAALLLQTADQDSALGNARTNSEVIKALLMAGAVKSIFPTWTRTTNQPLDAVYGAGQLNIYNSYKILTAGKQPASSTNTVGTKGWDFATTAGTSASTNYFFDVPVGHALSNVSVIVTWNRNVYDASPGPMFDPQVVFANLDLRLYTATNFTPVNLLDASVSTLDNVEHIHVTNPLAGGRYAMQVSWDLASHDYALAWSGTLVALPPPVLSVARSNDAVVVSWPLTAAGFTLQAATNLNGSVTWTSVPPPYQTNTDNYFIPVPEPTEQKYYRLQAP